MSIMLAKQYMSFSSDQKGFISYDSIDATESWIKYSLDQIILKKTLQSNISFIDRCIVLQALKKVEKKIEYHYNHKNFCLSVATSTLKDYRKQIGI